MLKSYNIKNQISQPYYTEGPVIDQEGNYFFTTLSGGTVMERSASGRMFIWATSPCPNGQVILPNNHHLVCDSKLASIIHYNSKGACIGGYLNGRCDGQKISTPNDLITDSQGNIYFSDSIRHDGKIGYISAEGIEKIIASGLDYPNGLALSTDEKILYVAESYKNRIIAFDLHKAHEARGRNFEKSDILWEINLPQHSSGSIAANLPDGIKTDINNNLWIAHYGMGMVHIYSPEKTLIQSIKTPFTLTSNLFLKNNTLIITGGDAEPGPGGLIEIEFNNEYETKNI